MPSAHSSNVCFELDGFRIPKHSLRRFEAWPVGVTDLRSDSAVPSGGHEFSGAGPLQKGHWAKLRWIHEEKGPTVPFHGHKFTTSLSLHLSLNVAKNPVLVRACASQEINISIWASQLSPTFHWPLALRKVAAVEGNEVVVGLVWVVEPKQATSTGGLAGFSRSWMLLG